MKRVFVLDANQRSALAVTRSLGKRCVPLVTGDESTVALSGKSRYSQQYISYPSPRLNPKQFISTIEKVCEKENISIIFPMTELTTTLLLKHRKKIPDIELPFAESNSIETLSNKCSLMKLARSLGISIPETQFFETTENIQDKLTDFTYPLVLKPEKSWLKHDDEWLHTCVRVANTPAQASKIIKSDVALHSAAFMVQEFIPGHGGGVFTLYNNGVPITFFSHNRLREKPPQGGVSVLSESIGVDPTLEKYSRALLDHLNWHGVAMIEFRITPQGKPYLMEINTRFWGSLQLAIDAGVDFPWLLYQTCISNDKEKSLSKDKPTSEYKTGVRLRWILGDIDSLYLVLRNPDIDLASKLKKIFEFFTPHPFITRHEVNRMADFKPFIWELKQYFQDIFSK